MEGKLQTKPMVLLGAGASVPAGIPTSVEMVQELNAWFGRTQGRPDEAQLFLAVTERFRNSSAKKVNIEEIYAAISLLAHRKQSLLFPFVERWASFVETISQHVFTETLLAIRLMLAQACRVGDPQKTKYLLPLAEQGREEAFTIATLNYDNTIELACEQARIPVDTKMEHWQETGCGDDLLGRPERGIELLKLHGSIRWQMREDVWTRKTGVLPPYVKEVSPQMGDFLVFIPAFVFGAGNKLRIDGPYLDLLRVFQRRLEEHEELLTVGYSFSDDHINGAINRWLRSSCMRSITVIDRQGATFETSEGYKNYSVVERQGRFVVRGVGAKVGIAERFSSGKADLK